MTIVSNFQDVGIRLLPKKNKDLDADIRIKERTLISSVTKQEVEMMTVSLKGYR